MFGGVDFSTGLARLERRLSIDSRLRAGYLATLDLMRRHDVAQHIQLRTVLCDGSLAIGYVNAIQPSPFTARQRRVNKRIVEALRRRLVVEHRLSSANLTSASLDSMLDAVGRAAFIVSRERRLLHANSLGERALMHDPMLAEELRLVPDRLPSGFEVTPITIGGSPQAHLVIKKMTELTDLAATISKQFTLGERTRSVFMLAVTGEANKTIATRLGLAENTVEYHMGVIFRRLGLRSRTELFQFVMERALKGR